MFDILVTLLQQNMIFPHGEDYLFNYSLLISTAVGVFTVILLIGLTIDVGVRVVKLGFYN